MVTLVVKSFKVIIFSLIVVWYGIFLTHKIDLTTADLGRHIQNGNIIVNAPWLDKIDVLKTNYYSYTLNDQSFINHHWGSGVVFYFIYLWFGFSGLSVLYALFGVLTVLVFWDIARRMSNFWVATGVAVVILPLVTTRAEVRPEVFTYFLTGVFFWTLYLHRSNIQYSRFNIHKLVWLLTLAMLLWVNLHIGFVFGFLVLGAFGLEQMIKDIRLKIQDKTNPILSKNFYKLLYISIISLIAGLINPNFIQGLLYPLNIFKNYGYLIVENQSVKFLENIGVINNQHFLLFKVVVIVTVISFIGVAIRNYRKIDIAQLVLVVVTAVMAYLGIRNFPSFALFTLPALAGSIYFIIPKNFHIAYKITLSIIVIVLVGSCANVQYQNFVNIRPVLGFGLLPEVNGSADFFKTNNLKGPIFNDYDIGGYLIFNLYPEKVYVDNRPEAYTNDFFQKEYIPAQENFEKWKEIDIKYNFNTIFFSHRDYTPWAQAFLVSKVLDPDWAPVFLDSYNIIFVRRSQTNTELIKKYEIPKERFGITE